MHVSVRPVMRTASSKLFGRMVTVLCKIGCVPVRDAQYANNGGSGVMVVIAHDHQWSYLSLCNQTRCDHLEHCSLYSEAKLVVLSSAKVPRYSVCVCVFTLHRLS